MFEKIASRVVFDSSSVCVPPRELAGMPVQIFLSFRARSGAETMLSEFESPEAEEVRDVEDLGGTATKLPRVSNHPHPHMNPIHHPIGMALASFVVAAQWALLCSKWTNYSLNKEEKECFV
ncbi:BQ5605_C013g07294 [Microbotryum silenes-dioicae]|uniref:BQ5605_C013g07262 protein n=1 Tax=Microbotryum silenes-dioicae TaxID=796604 RepID=A0A2X0MCR6_9BASI|nr:BQ5605_C013g07262 [Microbotryum silenes-dioicae]SGY15231.1 BQ5605_C013g07294 [Microbotryum silenes-dioicae]